MKKIIFVISAALTMTACSEQAADPKSVQYYLQHRDELASRIQDCKAKNDPGQDCQNASEAAGLSLMGGGRKTVRSISEIEAENAKK